MKGKEGVRREGRGMEYKERGLEVFEGRGGGDGGGWE